MKSPCWVLPPMSDVLYSVVLIKSGDITNTENDIHRKLHRPKILHAPIITYTEYYIRRSYTHRKLHTPI